MLVDYHTHTEFSDDSIYPMEKVIQDAISMNMKEICFTDHVDYGIKYKKLETSSQTLLPFLKERKRKNFEWRKASGGRLFCANRNKINFVSLKLLIL